MARRFLVFGLLSRKGKDANGKRKKEFLIWNSPDVVPSRNCGTGLWRDNGKQEGEDEKDVEEELPPPAFRLYSAPFKPMNLCPFNL